jgi:peptide/nickel transport system permease protein
MSAAASSATARPLAAARLRRWLAHRSLVLGAVLVAIVVVAALGADLIAAASPDKMNYTARFLPPGAAGWLGTDAYGRDVFSRVLHGARTSLAIGLGVVFLNAIFGSLIGAVAGYIRWLDNTLMRIMDGLMAFPTVLLSIAISATLGASILNVVIALAVTYVPRTARVVRASVLVLRETEFVEAAIVVGAGLPRILLRHLLPNAMAPLLVQLTFVFAYAVIAEAVLSFLGLGPPPPTPSWGNMIAEGRDYLREAFWISFFPGMAVAMTVLGLNLLGDGLRDVLDPRLNFEP